MILANGVALKSQWVSLAQSVGVVRPEHIRVGIVQTLPLPDDPLLRAAAVQTGLLGPNMIGLTLGYAVLVRRGHQADPRLLSHEFRHVYQYEAAGSIASFLPIYLREIVVNGYDNAPSEIDARAHERHGA
jgi:hypothetical protein